MVGFFFYSTIFDNAAQTRTVIEVKFFAPNPEEVFNRLGQLVTVLIYPFAIAGDVRAEIYDEPWPAGSAEDAAITAVCSSFGVPLKVVETCQWKGITWVAGFVPTLQPEFAVNWDPVRMLGGQVPPEIAHILIKLI